MIVGLILKDYKVYRNINIIPISFGEEFSAFLGANGIGKTSIFDALDKFFNGGDWSINHEAKSKLSSDNNPFIAPIFLIPKSHPFQSADAKKAEEISNFFWSYSEAAYANFVTQFKEIRDKLIQNNFNKDSHYLFCIGQKYQSGEPFFTFFESGIYKALFPHSPHENDDIKINPSDFNSILKSIKSYYRFIYLPAEADSFQFAKMESSYVQKLLDEDIKRKINESIGKKSVADINEKLEAFIQEINKSLERYVYKGTFKNKLTVNDLVDKVFEAYFGIKILHKKNKSHQIPIGELSSGEKRQALIDLSYSLISRSPQKDYQIILAIDEPDSSMHISACHDQFEKISRMPYITNPKTQVMVNTHWYGFIPIIQNGLAHSLTKKSEKIDVFTFNLKNFREHINQQIKGSKGQNPTEVELKSYQDMIQSVIVSMVRESPYNWIFCEGLSDKIYIDHYLSDLIDEKNLRVVPLGGYKEVRRVYQYLCAPLSDKEASFKGFSICLIDTDAQQENFFLDKSIKNLYFKRIVRNQSTKKVILVDADSQHSFPTEIEFSLKGEVFKNVIEHENFKNLKNHEIVRQIFKETKIIDSSENLYDYLNLSPDHMDLINKKFFDINGNKVDFANLYVKTDNSKLFCPEWILDLRKLLQNN